MGDENFRPSLRQGFAYDAEIFNGPATKRRISMGADAALESDQDRDPEGGVDDYDELVRCMKPSSCK
jgi:hypothetical protein